MGEKINEIWMNCQFFFCLPLDFFSSFHRCIRDSAFIFTRKMSTADSLVWEFQMGIFEILLGKHEKRRLLTERTNAEKSIKMNFNASRAVKSRAFFVVCFLKRGLFFGIFKERFCWFLFFVSVCFGENLFREIKSS